MNVFVDTSVFVRHFYGIEKAVSLLNRVLNEENAVVTSHVIEETFFKLIYIETQRLFGKTGRFYLRGSFRKNPQKYKAVREYLEDFILDSISSGILELVPVNSSILNDSVRAAFSYSLLANDALIASTCKFYRIKHIATFDKDFARVPFLKLVKV